jgi:small subunit ribosomal protein S8
MSLNDPLANLMSTMQTYDDLGKSELTFSVSSKLIKSVLDVMHKEGYIGTYEENDIGKGKELKINLLGRINKCGVIKPRFAVTVDEIEKFEKRYLIAKGFGFLIISTSHGVMTHKEAKEKRIGGKLIAYCY